MHRWRRMGDGVGAGAEGGAVGNKQVDGMENDGEWRKRRSGELREAGRPKRWRRVMMRVWQLAALKLLAGKSRRTRKQGIACRSARPTSSLSRTTKWSVFQRARGSQVQSQVKRGHAVRWPRGSRLSSRVVVKVEDKRTRCGGEERERRRREGREGERARRAGQRERAEGRKTRSSSSSSRKSRAGKFEGRQASGSDDGKGRGSSGLATVGPGRKAWAWLPQCLWSVWSVEVGEVVGKGMFAAGRAAADLAGAGRFAQ